MIGYHDVLFMVECGIIQNVMDDFIYVDDKKLLDEASTKKIPSSEEET